MVDRIDGALPQTQCTRCGYPNCRGYARAIADGSAGIDRCPPGGAEGIARIAAITGLPVRGLDPAYGEEGPRQLAVIDEAWCIGCTLCLDACPTDAILGRNKRMHTVLPLHCTGCERCVPVCPVDCIAMVPVSGSASGWAAWSQTQADEALRRYRAHVARQLQQDGDRPARGLPAMSGGEELEGLESNRLAAAERPAPGQALHGAAPADPKRALIEAAMQRARALRG